VFGARLFTDCSLLQWIPNENQGGLSHVARGCSLMTPWTSPVHGHSSPLSRKKFWVAPDDCLGQRSTDVAPRLFAWALTYSLNIFSRLD